MRRKWILSFPLGFAPVQMTRLERTLLICTWRCPPLPSTLKSQMAETALPPSCESLCHMAHLIMAGMEISQRKFQVKTFNKGRSLLLSGKWGFWEFLLKRERCCYSSTMFNFSEQFSLWVNWSTVFCYPLGFKDNVCLCTFFWMESNMAKKFVNSADM